MVRGGGEGGYDGYAIPPFPPGMLLWHKNECICTVCVGIMFCFLSCKETYSKHGIYL
jgi:hypothetical protein